MALTKLQKAFVYHSARSGKGAKASRDAGYSVSDAKNAASKLLKREDIRAAIVEAKVAFEVEMEALETSGWDSQRVKNEAVRLYERGVRESLPLPQLTKLLEVIGRHVDVGAFEKPDKVKPGVLSLKDRILMGRARVGRVAPEDESALAAARSKQTPVFTDTPTEEISP